MKIINLCKIIICCLVAKIEVCYYYTDTIMIDGSGCKWTNKLTTECNGMPTHDEKSTMTGNSGNGFAKITYLGSNAS